MKIDVSESGNFMKVESWLTTLTKVNPTSTLNETGRDLVNAVRPATPVDTGLTAHSWKYEVVSARGKSTLTLSNSSENGFNVIQALRYGHGTGTGGYVPPNDFVTPVVTPIIDNAANKIAKKVFK